MMVEIGFLWEMIGVCKAELRRMKKQDGFVCKAIRDDYEKQIMDLLAEIRTLESVAA